MFDTSSPCSARALIILVAMLLSHTIGLAQDEAPRSESAAQHHAAQSVEERVEQIDEWFASIARSKRSIPQAMLQTWVQLQDALRDLTTIASDSATPPSTAWRARYVAAYGLWTIELFDITADIDRELARNAADAERRALALSDLAQALENAGNFNESVAESAKLIASTERPGLLEYNNHALRLLKAGRYDECLDYVNRIELDTEAAHTRIFAARSLAYRGKYDDARAELVKACDLGEHAACSMIERLDSETPAAYWSDDRSYRERVWRPYNLVDSSIALAAARCIDEPMRSFAVSAFAPAFWFNEIHRFYPSLDDGREIVPTRPDALDSGRIGAVVLEGVPFFAARLHARDASAIDRAVAAYLAGSHGPSAWGDSTTTIRTRALVRELAKTCGDHLMVVVHTDWQEQWVRTRGGQTGWRTISPR